MTSNKQENKNKNNANQSEDAPYFVLDRYSADDDDSFFNRDRGRFIVEDSRPEEAVFIIVPSSCT